jgi:GWxTD domain-containing protein
MKLRSSIWIAGAIVLGMAACAPSFEIQLDPESSAFFENARLVMTGEEEDIFRHLPDEASRREFVVDFWAKRNPDPTAATNEFKVEFEKRIDYANKHFNEGRKGMNTDRGRIYIYLGPPEKTEYSPLADQTDLGSGPALWWIYYKYDLGVEFRDVRNMNSYEMVQVLGNLMQAMEEAKLGAVVQSQGPVGRYLDFEASYDASRREIVVKIPVKNLNFKEEAGLLKAAFDFEFYLYKSGAAKAGKFNVSESFSGKPEEVTKNRAVVFSFPYELPPGKTYVDIIVLGKDGLGKARKIFTLKN